ncbi:MAG: GtrA family protein [Ktedonobacteraceae bacterium]
MLNPAQHFHNELDITEQDAQSAPRQHYVFSLVLRFSLVGGLNTLVDLVILNGLLWLFPTTSTLTLLAYNSLAYSVGAINSFLLNKYWTFGQKQKTTCSELARFTLTTLFGIAWSTLILWLASLVLHPLLINTIVWANASKVIAIAGTSLISYLGMRLWVFVRLPQKQNSTTITLLQKGVHEGLSEHEFDLYKGSSLQNHESSIFTAHSLSVVLPVYNEEEVIASTMKEVLNTLRNQIRDFEVIVVNDGSSDHTNSILADIAEVGILALAWQRRPRFRENRQQQSLILWGVWLLTMAVFFSVANFFHQYYLSTFAPAICALFGIGVVVMWQDYRHSGWRGWLLPLALLLTAAEQIHIIMSNPSWGAWLIPVIAIACAVATVVLIAARLVPQLRHNSRILVPALCLGLMALMLTSAIWSAIPAIENIADNLPVAGPSQKGSADGIGGSITTNAALISYLEAHQGNATYLVEVRVV